jgi:superfamily II DNA or RNA helicase
MRLSTFFHMFDGRDFGLTIHPKLPRTFALGHELKHHYRDKYPPDARHGHAAATTMPTPISRVRRKKMTGLVTTAWMPTSGAEKALLRFLDGVGNAAHVQPVPANADLPEKDREGARLWHLLGRISLRRWQVEARERWFAEGCRGTVKVVTGAGKTHLALAIAEQLQKRVSELRMVVIVPTIVLLDQWYQTLVSSSNLPPEWIGRLGGGHNDNLSGEKRILLSVLATARRRLPEIIAEGGHQDETLIVVDECHRVGSAQSARVMEAAAAFRLGLSATPERVEVADSSALAEVPYSETAVGRWLGPIVFELNYSDAIAQEILCPFELLHYGLPLNLSERQKYEELSRTIHDTRDRLRQLSPLARSLSGERLVAWCRRMSLQSGEVGKVALAFAAYTSERKRLLYGAESRRQAAVAIVRDLAAATQTTRAILFHESIEEVERLYVELSKVGIPAVMEHSRLPSRIRRRSIECFRSGAARVIVSARSLIEGFNVPSADTGVIVASSSSTRQRIQSIGRVLRRDEAQTVSSKLARVCMFYIRDSVDETIYEKMNWTTLTGVERNAYFSWDPPDEPRRVSGPPRKHIPQDFEIDPAELVDGAIYPGRYEGVEYSADTAENVHENEGRIAINPQGIPARVMAIKGSAGKFKISPRSRHILVLRRATDGWETCFAGALQEDFRFAEANSEVPLDPVPGEIYLGPHRPSVTLRFSQKSNGTILRPVKNGELFARGPNADALVAGLRVLEHRFGRIARFDVNSFGHAFWTSDGITRFIGANADKLEFPSLTAHSDQ